MNRADGDAQRRRRLDAETRAYRQAKQTQWWKDFWMARPEHSAHGIVRTYRELSDGMMLVCSCGDEWFVTGKELAILS